MSLSSGDLQDLAIVQIQYKGNGLVILLWYKALEWYYSLKILMHIYFIAFFRIPEEGFRKKVDKKRTLRSFGFRGKDFGYFLIFVA